MFYSARAFLVGFSTNEFVDKLAQLASVIFTKAETKPPQQPPQ